ncbi:MAG: hypothetical protein AB1567_06610 [bacterium]
MPGTIDIALSPTQRSHTKNYEHTKKSIDKIQIKCYPIKEKLALYQFEC